MRDLAYGNLNLSTDTWGPEADRFDPDRFLKMESHGAASTGQIVTFGAGSRHRMWCDLSTPS